MTNKAIIENKISLAKKYLKILHEFKKYPRNEIETDVNIRGALERYLYLAMQATIDLAEATISLRNLRKPSTASEAFYILNEEKIIPEKLVEQLVAMVGFRNIIAHDYEKINYDIVYNVLHKRLNDIENFLKIISD